MPANWLSWFLPSARVREARETRRLAEAVRSALPRSPFKDAGSIEDFIAEIVVDTYEKLEVRATEPVALSLRTVLYELLKDEGFLANSVADDTEIAGLSIEDGVRTRAVLYRIDRFLRNHEKLLPMWRQKLAWMLSGMLSYASPSVFMDPDDREDGAILFPKARAADLLEKLPEVIERLVVTAFDEDVAGARLLEPLRETFERNLLAASGSPRGGRQTAERKPLFPTQNEKLETNELLETYLRGTPFRSFFETELPFAIPAATRFEHTHVLGGTGHGKTQLLQYLLLQDLRNAGDGRGIVVIDSQGDLYRNISRLALFDPDNEEGLAERLVLIDPTDVEHPVALNMFDFDRGSLEARTPLEREMVLNATVETYEFFFGALLGAELTARQGVIFRYLARLLLEIPDATIHTLRELMEDGERFRGYMARLSGSARHFFETQFFERQFSETKKQILARLWGVLSNATLERMFSHKENKVDLFRLLNEGKIVLINTAKDFLGNEGSSILGRFFISLVAQAALERATIPAEKRKPAFIYIDEAQDYFDGSIARLLNQARKYRMGLILAHQNLDQLDPALRATLLASTSIRFAGGLSAKDANALDGEMRTSSEYLLSRKKHAAETEFACYVRNWTNQAVSVRVPLGVLEGEETLGEEVLGELVLENRRRYSAPPDLPEYAARVVRRETVTKPARPETIQEEPSQPETVSEVRQEPVRESATEQSRPSVPEKPVPAPKPESPGKGGEEHRYLQQLVKRLAEERGFSGEIEATVGDGRIDVALRRRDLAIAVEISVTGTAEYELKNIEKCLAAGFETVWLVVTDRRKRERLLAHASEQEGGAKIRVMAPEELLSAFESLPAYEETSERVVGGRTIRVRRKSISPEDFAKRQAAVAEVIAKSLMRRRKNGR